MPDKPIQIAISSPKRTLDAARKALEKYGGGLTGDLDSGDVVAKTPVGDVVGRYTVDGDTLTIHIDRKPRLAPSGVVRNIVTHFFDNLDT